MLPSGNCSSVFDKIVSIFPRFFEVISSLRSWQFRFLLAQWKKRGRSAKGYFFLDASRMSYSDRSKATTYSVFCVQCTVPKRGTSPRKFFTSIATMYILWTKLLFKRLFYIQLFLSHRVFFFLIQRIIFIGSRHVTYYYYYYYFFIIIIIFLFRTHKQLQYITFTIHYR